VLRFWNNDVLANIESMLEVILEAVASPAPHPNPPPPTRGLLSVAAGERETSTPESEE
jgi:adenine-specific DNA-methyltransferase